MSNESAGPGEGEWRFDVGFLTDVGLHRERNEDAYHLFLPYAGEENTTAVDAVFAVADGMGGHEGGDIAGRFVAEAVGQELAVPGARAPTEMGPWFRAFLDRLNDQLCSVAREFELGRGVGSTLTMAVLRDDMIHLGHVGDSRCYRLRAGQLEQMTQDHSWVAQQVRAGLLSPEEAETHPDRNLLTQCLGIEGRIEAYVAEEPLEDGTRYLLCSDGLHGLVEDSVIARVLRDESEPQEAAARLVELALEGGGHDNVTVLVFDARRVNDMVTTLPGGLAADQDEPAITGQTLEAETPALATRLLRPEIALVAAGLTVIALALSATGWLALRGDEPANPAATAETPADTILSSPAAPQSPAATPDSLAARLDSGSTPSQPRPAVGAADPADSVWRIGEPTPDSLLPHSRELSEVLRQWPDRVD